MMAVDSGTYGPETVARRQKIAEQLLMQAVKPREIRSPLQGLGQLGEAALAGWEGYRADTEEKSSRKEAIAQALEAFGGGGQQPTTPMSLPAGATPGAVPAVDTSVPRGIRNNNPLNIEAGDFTKGQPGFAGSDGRFAKFDTAEQGTQAASALLDSYGRRGLNTPAGIVSRWAPAGDGGNNPTAYAAAVAQKLGIGPNDPVPPEMRPQLISAMGQQENGRPINATGGAPAAAQPPAPTQVAQNAPAGTGGPPNREAIVRALMNPWTPPALSGVLAQQGFAKPELKEGGSDPITGAKTWLEWDPSTRTMRPVNMGASAGGTPVPQGGMLAPGVTALDHSLSGDAYLNQFGPEMQSAVKAYINGDVLPTGNPRLQGIANAAKTIAQKYGQDMGVPVSDSLYAEKRKYRTELGSNMPSTAGGQAKAFNQGIEHMGALATTLEKLDNSNGLGIPLIADIINTGRQLTSTEQSAIADKARGIGQTLSGEVGKLFSGSAGGGVEERRLTRDRFDSVKSPTQMAAALEGTLETMRGGLTALEGRRDQILGPKNDVKFITADTEKKIAQIEAAISRLKGEKQTAPSAESSKIRKFNPATGKIE